MSIPTKQRKDNQQVDEGMNPAEDPLGVNPGNNFGTSPNLTPGTNFGTNESVSPGRSGEMTEIQKNLDRMKKEKQ
jgi:hypothetical protein